MRWPSSSTGSRPSRTSSGVPGSSECPSRMRQSASSRDLTRGRQSSPSTPRRCWRRCVSEQSPEEQDRLADQVSDMLRQLRVEDVLIQTLVTVSSIGYRRLGLTEDTAGERDLEQTRLAIETLNAVTPVLERFVPSELVRDFRQSIANLQLAYAKAAGEAGETGAADEPDDAGAESGGAEG